MACRIEPLESRIVLSVTGTVAVTGGETRLELTGDNGNDDYVIGVNASNNLTHTFPTGTGAGKFESNEDFDSSVAGVQKVPAGANTFVNITDSAGKDKLDFSGFSGPVDIRGGKPASSASSGSGAFTFTGIETLVGTDKNDTIRVNPGQGETFTVLGGAGDDTIIAAGDGDVSIEGGDGKDSIEANNKKGSATVDAGAGDDTVTVRSDKASVQGGNDNDTLIGKSDKLAQGITLDGGDGNDTIRGGKAKETLLGGTGDDSITGSGNDSCDGGDGKDNVNGVIGRNTITGGTGNDQLVGGRGTTLIERGNGILVLTQNTLTIDDGKISESDTLTGISRVQLEGGAGNDKLDASAFNGLLTVIGGAGNDTMTGGTGGVTFNGGAGNDQITGNSKNDLFFAGLNNAGPLVLLGDDFFTDSSGSDLLSGIDGANLQNLDDIGREIDASSVRLFPVTMQGGAGQDIMTGGLRPDRILALGGNDTIFISPGNDIVSGGPDSDLFSAEPSTTAVKIRFSKVRGSVSSTFVDTGGDKVKFRNSIADFENFSGSKLDDTIAINAPSKIDFGVQGNGGNDKMTGTGAGGLFLFGGEGNDVINSRQSFGGADGGGGDDKITATSRFGILLAGGAGKDLIVAGPGDDLITAGDNEVDTVDGGAGKDKLLSSDPDDVIRNVE